MPEIRSIYNKSTSCIIVGYRLMTYNGVHIKQSGFMFLQPNRKYPFETISWDKYFMTYGLLIEDRCSHLRT